MILFVIMAIAGVVLTGLALPLVIGRVGRNDFYGVRTSRTMNGPLSEWYAVNKKVGVVMSISGAALFAFGCVGALMKWHSYLGITCALGIFLCIIIVTVMRH